MWQRRWTSHLPLAFLSALQALWPFTGLRHGEATFSPSAESVTYCIFRCFTAPKHSVPIYTVKWKVFLKCQHIKKGKIKLIDFFVALVAFAM